MKSFQDRLNVLFSKQGIREMWYLDVNFTFKWNKNEYKIRKKEVNVCSKEMI